MHEQQLQGSILDLEISLCRLWTMVPCMTELLLAASAAHNPLALQLAEQVLVHHCPFGMNVQAVR